MMGDSDGYVADCCTMISDLIGRRKRTKKRQQNDPAQVIMDKQSAAPSVGAGVLIKSNDRNIDLVEANTCFFVKASHPRAGLRASHCENAGL